VNRPIGWIEAYLYTFVTSALEGGVWSASRPGRFTPGKDPVSIVQEAVHSSVQWKIKAGLFRTINISVFFRLLYWKQCQYESIYDISEYLIHQKIEVPMPLITNPSLDRVWRQLHPSRALTEYFLKINFVFNHLSMFPAHAEREFPTKNLQASFSYFHSTCPVNRYRIHVTVLSELSLMSRYSSLCNVINYPLLSTLLSKCFPKVFVFKCWKWKTTEQ
jgi:hypothetical protein